MPGNQIAWNSNNQGIKEKINQNNQVCKAADGAGRLRKTSTPWGELLLSRADFEGGADLRGKLGLRADRGLQLGLPQWEKLPVSQESSLKSALERSRLAALFPLWLLPHRQRHSAAKRVALTG